ncbi:MAG: SDR family NAD(P)-dependent oxidoreductase, partial [Bacteroidota bacterium]
MDLKLKDKVIIVTGGSKGVGNGICNVLAAEGAIPVIVGRTQKDVINAEKELTDSGKKAFHAFAELTDPEQCKAVIDKVITQFNRIDGLVNNAGVNDGVSLEHGNYKDFIQSINRNLTHYYMMAHYALPYLK